MIKIGTDLDDCVNQFMRPYLERFGQPKGKYDIAKNIHNVLSKDREFWLNLPILHRPDFTPTLYCTKRIHNKAWTRRYLELNDLPIAPIYQIYCQSAPKSTRIKGRIDCFVDDSVQNFIEMNMNGVPCLLMDSEYNQEWGPIGRLYSLMRDEIEDAFELFIDTIFPYFKEVISERHSKLY